MPRTCSRTSRFKQGGFRSDFFQEHWLLAENEFELQQVAQGESPIPDAVDRVAGSRARSSHYGEFDDRAVDEPVDRAVPIERGDRIAYPGLM